MARGKGKHKGKGKRRAIFNDLIFSYTKIQKSRFNGRDHMPYEVIKMSEKINIRLYYGGKFVTKKGKTTYEPCDSEYYGLSLHPNVDELAYFVFKDWVIRELGYKEKGQLWFRKAGHSLFSGRQELKDDGDITDFLFGREDDGWYHLYLVHEPKGVDYTKFYGPINGFYTDIESEGGTKDLGCFIATSESNQCDSATQSHMVSSGTREEDAFIDNPRPENGESLSQKAPLTTTNQNTLSLSSKPTQQTDSLPTQKKTKKRLRLKLQPIPETQHVVQPSELESFSDVSDPDVCLSEGDYEDKSDDDLFAKFVDHEISDTVANSLGGPIRSHRNTESEGHAEGVVGGDIQLNDDEDLNDSDDDLHSVHGSDDELDAYPVFNPDTDFKKNIQFSLGLKFPTKHVFRKALRHHAIENGYNYYFLHNKSHRITVYCRRKCDCEWKKGRLVECNCKKRRKCLFKVYAAKVKDEETFQINSLRLTHVCGHQHVNDKVNAEYLDKRYLEDFRDDPSYKMNAFMKRVRRELGVEVGYYNCYNAKQQALRMIYGEAADEYKKVWEYVETIRKYYPGSSAVVKLQGLENPPPIFQRMYICLQPCKEGFMAGCRPILGVDGCHLRGPYPGILLTAVGKDGNNNIFPVAWAVVETENSESWTWFLNLLVKDLGSVAESVTWVREHEDTDVAFMSDRQKGLLDAFRTVIPNAETRYCCRHIWTNFKGKFPGEAYRECFWKAARSSTKHQFDSHMKDIKKLNVEAYNYLAAIPVSHWSRHGFSTRAKSGMLLNDCCESFNNVLKEARAKPILSLMEWIRRYVMMRCCAKREGLKDFEGVIMPSVVKMIERGQKQIYNLRVTKADVHEFEVDDEGDTYVVNLESKSCGCYRWTLMGIPCWHALSCIAKKRHNYEEYVHPAYLVTTYAATYGPAFHAMLGQKQWERSTLPEPLPPPYRVMPGRPSKKKRKKEPGEGKDKYVKRPYKQNNCSRCGGVGHNAKKCFRPLKKKGPVNKGGRPRKNDKGATTSAAAATQTAPTSSQLAKSSSRQAAPTSTLPAPTSSRQAAPSRNKKRKTASINAIQASQPSQNSCVSGN